MEAMKYHLLPERRPMLQSPRTKPRKSTVGSLYAVGGMDASKGGPLFRFFLTFLIAVPFIAIFCTQDVQQNSSHYLFDFVSERLFVADSY